MQGRKKKTHYLANAYSNKHNKITSLAQPRINTSIPKLNKSNISRKNTKLHLHTNPFNAEVKSTLSQFTAEKNSGSLVQLEVVTLQNLNSSN